MSIFVYLEPSKKRLNSKIVSFSKSHSLTVTPIGRSSLIKVNPYFSYKLLFFSLVFPGCEAGEYFYIEITKKDKMNISVAKCFK